MRVAYRNARRKLLRSWAVPWVTFRPGLAARQKMPPANEADDLFIRPFDDQRRVSCRTLLQPGPIRRRIQRVLNARVTQLEDHRLDRQGRGAVLVQRRTDQVQPSGPSTATASGSKRARRSRATWTSQLWHAESPRTRAQLIGVHRAFAGEAIDFLQARSVRCGFLGGHVFLHRVGIGGVHLVGLQRVEQAPHALHDLTRGRPARP